MGAFNIPVMFSEALQWDSSTPPLLLCVHYASPSRALTLSELI
jgi:hypothetical protein